MRSKNHFLSYAFFVSLLTINLLSARAAEKRMTQQDYINKFKDDAIKEMLMHKVPASITLAQGMLESDNGNSPLAIYANNHFGIKCHNEWDGPVFLKDDDKKNECFRKYEKVIDSYNDHSLFLKTRSRYSFLFELKITDYKKWAKGLKEAGYATDPKYPEKLIQIIEDNNLFEFDNISTLPSISPSIVHHHENTKTLADTHIPEILKSNDVNYVVVKDGDSFSKIAKELDMRTWQLYKYNELTENDKLTEGQRIYIQPKRRKAKEQFHIVKEGETMYSISQLYGLKLSQLYRKNLMKPEEEPKAGDKLWLRKRKKEKE